MKVLVAALLLSTVVYSGEKPRMTGDLKLDLFGPAAMSLPDTDKPSIPSLVEESRGEKSPWLAGAMSLLVPGAGEAYSQSYLKGAIFLAAEATSWIFRVSYNRKGDNLEAQYHDYANQHYSAVRYVNWTLDNLSSLDPAGLPYSNTQYSQMIYGSGPRPDPSQCGPPFSCINWPDLNRMETDIANGALNGYTHQMPYWNEQQYYELIGKYSQFSRGWDDSDPNDPRESVVPIQSTSKRFYEYAAMRAKANDYYDVANTFIGVIVANHILSAADAFWSATRLNSSLHASLNMYMQPTAIGLIPVTEANIRYDF